jgi:hypothetical protein
LEKDPRVSICSAANSVCEKNAFFFIAPAITSKKLVEETELHNCIDVAIQLKLRVIVFINKVYYQTKQRAAAIRRIDKSKLLTLTWSPDFARAYPELNPVVVSFAAEPRFFNLNSQLGNIIRDSDPGWPPLRMYKYDFGFSGENSTAAFIAQPC